MTTKLADLNDILSQIREGASGAGAGIQNWFSRNPEMRKAILRGLAGATIGGGLGAAAGALGPRDPEGRRGVLGPALTAALLGGTAAAGLPLGLKYLGGDLKLKGEPARSPASRVADSIVSPMVQNPLTTAGAAFGLGYMPGHASLQRWRDQWPLTGGSSAYPRRPSLASRAWGAVPKNMQDLKNVGTRAMDAIPRNVQELKNVGTQLRTGVGDMARGGAEFGKRVGRANQALKAEDAASRANWTPKTKGSFKPGRFRAAALPMAVILGMLGDRYLKGNG